MTYAERNFMGTESHGCQDRPRQRLAIYLRGQYRRDHRTKRLAADINATAKTAENILNGHWPSDMHLAAIVRRFGEDVLRAVFAPEIEPELARLDQEERELEEALELVRQRRRQAAGGPKGREQLLASPKARSFGPKG